MKTARRRILLVDDHALVREGLRLVLRGLEPAPEIVEAGSLTQALERAHAARFDLVLLDYFLPDSNGTSGLTQILGVVADTPVVVMSGECDGELVRQALRAGARGFVPKKSTAEVLLAALALVASGGTYLPPDVLSSRAPEDRAPSLTARQRDVLQLLVDGKTNKEIAVALGTSESTVRVHLGAIFRALGVENRTQACGVAIRRQLVERR